MERAAGKKTLHDLFWGRAIKLERSDRIAMLLFIIASIVSMSYTQLGFFSCGVIDGKAEYLLLLLGPLVLGSFAFGPLTGGLLGLFSGTVVYLHAQIFPLDFYEIYFMTPLNSFVLMTITGAASGWLFDIVLHKDPTGASRKVRIVATCLVISFAVSALVQVNTVIMYGGVENIDAIRSYLLPSPLGTIVQALVDALLMSVLCSACDAITNSIAGKADKRSMLSVFRSWMAVISLGVFMIFSAVNFSMATLLAQSDANDGITSESKYLVGQLNSHRTGDYDVLLSGYDPHLDGYVVITDKNGIILATDDETEYPKGKSFLQLIGFGDYTAVPGELFEQLTTSAESSLINVTGEDGIPNMDIVMIEVEPFDDGYVSLLYFSEKIYENRANVMLSSTALALALVLALRLMLSRLLNTSFVQHIDETNTSLDKITKGDLSERIDVHGNREFASLSAGINTMVSALKDSIDEAEHRNAQELMAAKAIQENSLPTDFPAFPDIDRFDIYASMKTAKEVGGDFYDFFLIDDSTRVGFVMADVSGKGIPAALFMMTAKTHVRSYMESGLPIAEAIDATNHQLCIGNDAGMFVTMFACSLDYETGALSYVNAGHNPPLLMHDGRWEWMRDISGMPLGLFDGMPYDSFERQLEVEDMMYLYTDGVTEAMNVDGELFTDERLEETLYKYVDFNPRSTCVGVRRAITDFTHDCEQSDDITMLALKYGVPPEETAVMILPADVGQLVHVYNYIHAELHRRHAPKSVYNPLDIAAEELFVNACHYAYPPDLYEGLQEVRISFKYDHNPPSLTVQIADDGIPYNPLSKPDAVTPDDIMDVPIGGLGLLMAKRSVDEMTYERAGNSNVLTFKKAW